MRIYPTVAVLCCLFMHSAVIFVHLLASTSILIHSEWNKKPPRRHREKILGTRVCFNMGTRCCVLLGSFKRRSRLPPKHKWLWQITLEPRRYLSSCVQLNTALVIRTPHQLQNVGKEIKWQSHKRRRGGSEHRSESNYAVKLLKMPHISLFIFF